MIRQYLESLTKKHGKKFSLFLIIGMFKVPLAVGLNWFLIDIMRIWSLLSSALSVSLVMLTTYFVYAKMNVINPAFWQYMSATLAFNIVTILLIWVLVDFIGLSGAISSAIVIGAIFILRYVSFHKMGIVNI